MSRSDRPAPPPGTPDHLSGHHYGDQGNQGHHGDDGGNEGPGKATGRAAKVNWDEYDASRIWQMVANEGNSEAEGLVWAFYVVSQYVDDTRLRLVAAGKSLALGWSGAAASDSAQALLTEITDAMVKDTANYVTATRELEQIVARLTESKREVEPLYEHWVQLQRLPGEAGIFATTVTESDVYKNEVEHTNDAAREEMRRLDRDLEGARITTTDDFVPSTGVPSADDLQLAGLGPQAIDAAHGGGGGGGGLGRGLLSGGGLPPAASVVPGGGLPGVGGGIGATGPMRPAMPGVIGGDAAAGRPMAGGMMGGAMGAGAHGAGGDGGGGGGRADTQWETRHGVSPVIDGSPPPKQNDGR